MASGDRDSARSAPGAAEMSRLPAEPASGRDDLRRRPERARVPARAAGWQREGRKDRGAGRRLGVGVHGRGVLGPHPFVVGLGVGDRRAGQAERVRENERPSLRAVRADGRGRHRRRQRGVVRANRGGGLGGRLLGPDRGVGEPVDVGRRVAVGGRAALAACQQLRGYRPVVGDRGVQPSGQPGPGRRGLGQRLRTRAGVQLTGDDFGGKCHEIHSYLCLTTAGFGRAENGTLLLDVGPGLQAHLQRRQCGYGGCRAE